MFKNITIFFCLLFFLTLANSNFAFSQIKVSGNKKISSDTIIGYFLSKNNLNNFSQIELNEIQKKLFQTGFFKNIEIKLDSNSIFVNVE